MRSVFFICSISDWVHVIWGGAMIMCQSNMVWNQRETVLFGNEYVDKSNIRIELRGKLDSVCVLVDLIRENFLEERPSCLSSEDIKHVSLQLLELLNDLRSLQIAEAKNDPPIELVAKYAVKQKELRKDKLYPSDGYDIWGGLISYLRTQIREAEVVACRVPRCACVDAIQLVLNAMSLQAASLAEYWDHVAT